MRLLILSIILLFSVNINAQNIPFKFKSYSLEEGLSQSTVYAFLEDDLGYIWIGTRDGLNRFDYNKFVTFYPSFDKSNSLTNRSIRSLVQDSAGYIWIGTDGGGVDRFNPKTGKFNNLCDLIDSKNCELRTNITKLEIKENELLIGTRSKGFYTYNIRENTLQQTLEVSSTIWDIKSKKGLTALGTSNGIILINHFNDKPFLEDHEIRAIEFIGESEILIGSRENGVMKLDLKANTIIPINEQLSHVEVSDLQVDNKNNIWIATDSKGIFHINSHTTEISHFTSSNRQPHQLQSSSIRTLYEDSNGIMWIGTNNAGLSNYYEYRFQFQGYSNYSTNGELTADVILSFNELDNGKILIGTEQSGLLVFDRDNGLFSSISNLNNENVIAIEKDKEGGVWLATDGSGLLKIEDQSRLNQIKKVEDINNESILSLETDPKGSVIAGAYQGLYIIENGEAQNMSYVPDFIKKDRVLAIETIGDNNYLLGTFSNGLVLFNKNDRSFKKLDLLAGNGSQESLNPDRVQAIYTDLKGIIWIGTYSGLFRFNPEEGSFKNYTTKDGIPSDVIYGILEDSVQFLWLSTNSGISRFDTENEHFVNYTILDGLLSNEFNGGAYFKDSSGNMYFGGVKGFTVFNPFDIKSFDVTSKIVIYEMNVDGEIYNTLALKNITLETRQDYIQFDFSYLNFLNSNKNILEYKLTGLSENWVPIEERRSVNFSGLPSGEYDFQIRTISSDGKLASLSNSISFFIKPSFWKTWYFAVGILALLFSISYILFKYRMHYLLKEEETRNRIARDLHDDLSATLSSISFFSEAAKRDNYLKSEKFLKRIDESAFEAKEKINDIIWAIDPNNDDWNAFLSKCKRYAAEMFESKNIEYLIDIDTFANHVSDSDLRHDLWLAFKEMITNIIRHSEATKAQVILKKIGKKLYLTVEDNGVGLSKEAYGKGNGISNLEFRAKNMTAELKFESVNPSGSKWILAIPV